MFFIGAFQKNSSKEVKEKKENKKIFIDCADVVYDTGACAGEFRLCGRGNR